MASAKDSKGGPRDGGQMSRMLAGYTGKSFGCWSGISWGSRPPSLFGALKKTQM